MNEGTVGISQNPVFWSKPLVNPGLMLMYLLHPEELLKDLFKDSISIVYRNINAKN